MIEFIDTQLVQCYKEILNGSNKKISNPDDYNEDMAMTRWGKEGNNNKWLIDSFFYLFR